MLYKNMWCDEIKQRLKSQNSTVLYHHGWPALVIWSRIEYQSNHWTPCQNWNLWTPWQMRKPGWLLGVHRSGWPQRQSDSLREKSFTQTFPSVLTRAWHFSEISGHYWMDWHGVSHKTFGVPLWMRCNSFGGPLAFHRLKHRGRDLGVFGPVC